MRIELNLENAAGIEPLHEVREPEKLEKLIASIRANGWTGRPLLVMDMGDYYQGITGSHRVAALKALNAELNSDECDDEVFDRLMAIRIPVYVVDDAVSDAIYDQLGHGDDENVVLLAGDAEAAKLMQAEIDANCGE